MTSDRRFKKLLENLYDNVSVIGLDGNLTWSSGADAGALGYDAYEGEPFDIAELAHPDDKPRLNAIIEQLAAEPETPVAGEARFKGADNDYHWVAFTARNRTTDPDIGGVVVTSRVIDDVVCAREESKAYRDRLEHTLSAQADFVATISHEMRTPLHAISGLTELLLDEELAPLTRRHVESIGSEGTNLRRIIDDLLDFSKATAGKMELNITAISPTKVIDSAVTTVRPLAEQKGLTLNVSMAPDIPPTVLGDELRARQVALNLMSNAVKYTDSGSVSVDLRLAENRIRLTVADTGPGIQPEAIDSLFDPYQQASAGDAIKGTGLGLAITRQLTRLMGGEMDFTTGPDGTTFWIDLPYRLARRSSDVAPETATIAGGGRVLVVDDSPVNVMLATAQLKKLGYETESAESGAAALEFLRSNPVDLILMDWHMPDMDGLETTRRLRADGIVSPDLPIIAATASVMSGDREKCLEAGMNDFLSKPVSLDDLNAMLERWIVDQAEDDGEAERIDHIAIAKFIVELSGGTSYAERVVDAFLDDYPNWRTNLQAAAAAGDLRAVHRSARRLRQVARGLGLTRLASKSAQLEKLEPTDDLVDAVTTAIESTDECATGVAAVREQIKVAA